MAPYELDLHKVVVLGDGGVGKTALTMQLCLNHYDDDYDPTIEDSYRAHAKVDGATCIIEVLDTAGQEDYASLRHQWIGGGDAFVLVYSVSSKISFDRIVNFYSQILKMKEPKCLEPPPPNMEFPRNLRIVQILMSHWESIRCDVPENRVGGRLRPLHIPMVLIANKCDEDERIISSREGRALAHDFGCPYFEASAKTRRNVEKPFFLIVRRLRKQLAKKRKEEKKKELAVKKQEAKDEKEKAKLQPPSRQKPLAKQQPGIKPIAEVPAVTPRPFEQLNNFISNARRERATLGPPRVPLRNRVKTFFRPKSRDCVILGPAPR